MMLPGATSFPSLHWAKLPPAADRRMTPAPTATSEVVVRDMEMGMRDPIGSARGSARAGVGGSRQVGVDPGQSPWTPSPTADVTGESLPFADFRQN
ncbi:hypothetical protein GCM10009633_15660 [Janibacter melonis]